MNSAKLKKLLIHQQVILSKLALGASLESILYDICLAIEDVMNDKLAKSSIVSFKEKQLINRASPNLHPQYLDMINGLYMEGENNFFATSPSERMQTTIIEDIENYTFNKNSKTLTLKQGLKCCLLTPIFSTRADLLGLLVVFCADSKALKKHDFDLINFFVNVSSIALEKKHEFNNAQKLVASLQQSNEKFKAFTQVMPDLILILNEEGVYTDVYGTSNDLLLESPSTLVGQNVHDLFPKKDAQMIMAVIKTTLFTNEMQIFEYELQVPKGNVTFEGRAAALDNYLPDAPSQRHIVWMARDVSIRKKAEQEARKLAFFDPLTSLPNRRMLSDKLKTCVKNIKQNHMIGALLFLDVDNFKRINDSLGHSAGDEILVELATRLSSIIQSPDILARAGGDEFIVLLENIGNDLVQAGLECESLATSIQSMFLDKFEVGNLAFQVSCSIGICLIDYNNAQTDNILKFADTAMYRSKSKGGNSSSFYDPALQTLLEKQAELETDIVRAIACGEFCAYFQPQFNLQGIIVGAEALIRWNHPSKGLIAPSYFISIAEQYGLIQKLQNIVLEDICILIKELMTSNLIDDSFSISINISQSQFNSSNLKYELFNTIKAFDIHPSRIKLEITESMLSTDIEYTIKQMEELISAGFVFSIDDFGTGYSCLTYLSAFPVQELKIDKSFIGNMVDTVKGSSIVKTIVSLGKSLNLDVVAEGVETIEQHRILTDLGIDSMQGYLMAQPMCKESYIKLHEQQGGQIGYTQLN